MATIKAIEAGSVHQIQSGQVIIDLCSVAKELVENSLDAGANSVEVRFKNYGLDAIEVQDNGAGILSSDYETVALKHYTSKLSNYEDLSRLQTFGFRGEALSSLCALSRFSITTARADEAPKGARLEFEISGKLKDTSVIACQKGTTVLVENLFFSLPVRKKELAKNIKREYGKVIGLLHAYACISTNVKFTVKNAMPKAKGMTVFATQSNTTTRENIANVYGAKTLSALAPLDLHFELQPAATQRGSTDLESGQVRVEGHISKPVFGEGRQTPDRQMFFVNGRPCGLPQIAKAVNEVYRSFNVSQSPFVLANFLLDTDAYDVNVSPDKRSVMLHNAETMIDSLKESLTSMFDTQHQTVPHSQSQPPRLPLFRPHVVSRAETARSSFSEDSRTSEPALVHGSDDSRSPSAQNDSDTGVLQPKKKLHDFFSEVTSTRVVSEELDEKQKARLDKYKARRAEKIAEKLEDQMAGSGDPDEYNTEGERERSRRGHQDASEEEEENVHVRDFNARMNEQQVKKLATTNATGQDPRTDQEQASSIEVRKGEDISASSTIGVVPDAFARMRPRRVSVELATIEADGNSTVTVIGNKFGPRIMSKHSITTERSEPKRRTQIEPSQFSQALRKFSAPGSAVVGDDRSSSEEQSDMSDGDRRLEDAAHASKVSSPVSDLESAAEDAGDLSPTAMGREGTHNEPKARRRDLSSDRHADANTVADLIRTAEQATGLSNREFERRTALKGGQKDLSTTQLQSVLACSLSSIKSDIIAHVKLPESIHSKDTRVGDDGLIGEDAEEKLNLTISKADFARMKVIGQFNKGFIIAVRPRREDDSTMDDRHSLCDELFMVDQHASDEKYNFERLQAETVVGSQRSVRPLVLELTAVEEEVVMENQKVIERNGFLLDVDTSGESLIGGRVKLVGLPLSKEDVFDTKDLEELIHLLTETPTSGESASIPRPSKVRKMFAMRACRSSIMIGKSLTKQQMEKLLLHMGTIDKPWNCPHGRPTMRHVGTLDHFPSWQEGDGLAEGSLSKGTNAWQEYFA